MRKCPVPDTDCLFHQPCPVPDDCYVICYECLHAYTEYELLYLANRESHRIAVIHWAQTLGLRVWNPTGEYVGPDPDSVTVAFIPWRDAGDVRHCPLCQAEL